MELSRRGLWETGAVVAVMHRAPVRTLDCCSARRGSSATAVYRI